MSEEFEKWFEQDEWLSNHIDNMGEYERYDNLIKSYRELWEVAINSVQANLDAKDKELEALRNRACRWVKCEDKGEIGIDYEWHETQCGSAHKALTKFCPSCGGMITK